ncbi:hypothetical protein [Mycolicibacterium sp. lyk4-40-TYG-92]|uniref:hypothetical protein n=1 Tax=Mycolicibacterium sp. lyk4-40-TYG-92 TaxID=3040295 RepID=UPI00254D325B|nr:hypothetical protein [Mycolicibacterium sp. lyk4-40-TYG-92]
MQRLPGLIPQFFAAYHIFRSHFSGVAFVPAEVDLDDHIFGDAGPPLDVSELLADFWQERDELAAVVNRERRPD